MGKKTVWAVCAFNILAGGFAIAWVTRPHWQSRTTPSFEAPAPPARDPEACWSEFSVAATYDAARNALAGIAPDERRARLTKFLKSGGAAAAGGVEVAQRRAAALAIWGETIQSGSEDDAWLRELAMDRGLSALERETALRAVTIAAHRRHKAAAKDPDSGDDAGWREAFAAYLARPELGPGSGLEGFALQARCFALMEGVAPVGREALIEQARRVLAPYPGSREVAVISALDVARQLGAEELREEVRALAREPRSEACLLAAFGYLAAVGTEADLEWLSGHVPTSASAQVAAANARAVLASRMAAPSPSVAGAGTHESPAPGAPKG